MRKISLVIPTVGRIKYLDITIESALNQTEAFAEVIVFDNSKEQNLKDISKFGNKGLVKFVCSRVQLNAIDSWNTAVKSANYEYVTIMGDDDVLLDNYCENAVKLLELSEVGILKAFAINENGDRIKRLPYPGKFLLSDKEFRTMRYLNKISLFVPGIIFKKELFLKVGGFKNSYIDGFACSDDLLLTQLSLVSKNIAVSEDFCWCYRVHQDQIAGVKDISTYVDRTIKYIELYESSLLFLGIDKSEIYPNFSKKDYIGKICRYGINLYGAYCGKNKNFLSFFYNIYRYFIRDKRISFGKRLLLTIYGIKGFLGAKKIGQWLKRAINL